MNGKTKKCITEIILSLVVGILLSLLVLLLHKFISFGISSFSFVLVLVILATGLYCLNFLEKYHFSLKIIEISAVVISLLITLIYVHTISLSVKTELELMKIMVVLHLSLFFITLVRLYLFRKTKNEK